MWAADNDELEDDDELASLEASVVVDEADKLLASLKDDSKIIEVIPVILKKIKGKKGISRKLNKI